MKETYGVPVKEIQEAIKHGVRKINIDTDIRLAMTGAVRKFLAENPEKFDAREWLKPAREAAKLICKQRYIEFGCEGQGAKIKGDTLQVVAAKYAKGELAQEVVSPPGCAQNFPRDSKATVRGGFFLRAQSAFPSPVSPQHLPLLLP
jgi:fructose-bisphosphate aldolase class II